MSREKRGYDRENLVRADIPGAFEIEIDGTSHAFGKVNDVSISGMGINMPMSLTVGKPVVIRYVSEDFRVALNANIAWCVKSDDGFRIGVQFSTENLDANVMFFMTLREYIDDFGEAF